MSFERLAAALRYEPTDRVTDSGKDPHAVALGRKGGRKGGRARADKLSPERRREIARLAATARWNRVRADDQARFWGIP